MRTDEKETNWESGMAMKGSIREPTTNERMCLKDTWIDIFFTYQIYQTGDCIETKRCLVIYGEIF